MAGEEDSAEIVVGRRIRQRRQELGLSQMDVGELASMHFTNFGKIERGDANPSLITLVRIAVALDLNPAVLVDGLGIDNLEDVDHRVTANDLIIARRLQGKRGAYRSRGRSKSAD